MTVIGRARSRVSLTLQLLAGRARYAGMTWVAVGAVLSAGSVAVLLTVTPAGQVLQEAAGGAIQALATLAGAQPARARSDSEPAASEAAVPVPVLTSAPAGTARAGALEDAPTATVPAPSATLQPPAATAVPAGVAAPLAPAATPRPPTNTPVPPTQTPPSSATLILPTLTPIAPTLTPIAPTLTPPLPNVGATLTSVTGSVANALPSATKAPASPTPGLPKPVQTVAAALPRI